MPLYNIVSRVNILDTLDLALNVGQNVKKVKMEYVNLNLQYFLVQSIMNESNSLIARGESLLQL